MWCEGVGGGVEEGGDGFVAVAGVGLVVVEV